MALVNMAQVPEAFVEVTVSSNRGLRTLVSHPQKVLHKNAMQKGYGIKASLGGFSIHTAELLTRLDRGEEAWIPDLQSSDESTDEGPVKPTLKRWPKKGAWWDQYRSPIKYPSSDSSSSDDDEKSEADDEKPQRGGCRLTILRRIIPSSSKGSGFQSVKPPNNGSQSKKLPGNQAGKKKSNPTESDDFGVNTAMERREEEEQQISCPACDQSFKSKISLSNHLRWHSKEKAYECSFCRERFSSKKRFVTHQRIHAGKKNDHHQRSTTENPGNHPERMPYQCPECKRCFMLKDQFLLHYRRHAVERPHKCCECEKSFTRKQHLNRHKKLHISPETKMHPEKKGRVEDSPKASEKKSPKAPVCEITSLSNIGSTIDLEIQTKASEKKSPKPLVREITRLSDVGSTSDLKIQTSLYKCQFCGKCLRSKTLLVDHERVHREMRTYKCSHCQKKFHYKHFLRTHQRIHMRQAACERPKRMKILRSHSDSRIIHRTKNPSKAPDSRKIFTRSVPSNRHQKKGRFHYECQYCRKCLSTNAALANHEKLHTGERPYKCHDCTQSFIRIHHLLRHQEIHMKQRSFGRIKPARKWRRKNHLNVLEGIQTGRNLCKDQIYMQSITHSSSLTRYQKSHTEGKWYECQHCGKCMKKKALLINHMRTHKKRRKTYQCPKCRESFSWKNHLAAHERSHGREKLSVCSDSGGKATIKKPPSILKHDNRLNKQVTCCYCSNSFDDNYSLTRHQRTCSVEKQFRCSTCGKGFFAKWNLKRHESTHLKRNGFKQSMVAEVNHQRAHLTEKSSTCTVCGKDFNQTWLLKRHVKTHLKGRGFKQSMVNHVFSSSVNCVFSQEKDHGDLPANIKLLTASKISENNILEDICESETEPQPVLGEGFEMGAHGDSEQQKMQVEANTKLSRKFKGNTLQNDSEGPATQSAKPEERLRQEDSIVLNYKKDKHCIQQQNQPRKYSKKTHLQSCDNAHVGRQLRSQAMSRRKSQRKMPLASNWARSCFCLQERTEMAPRKLSTSSRVCKKLQNSRFCSKIKAYSQRGTSATTSSSSIKNCRLGRPCPSLPFQRTIPGKSKMEATENTTRKGLAGSEQIREPQKVLRKEPDDNANSQSSGTEQCPAYNASKPRGPQASPRMSESDLEQNGGRIQVAKGPSNASHQEVGTAPIEPTSEEMAGNPFSDSHDKGGGCTESLRKTLKEPKRQARQREFMASQQQSKKIQAEHVCSQCNKSLRSRENLFIHEKNHREMRPFPCNQCERSFYTERILKVHMSVHTGEKPFKCSECDFTTSTSSNLNNHKKTCGNHWKPYSCQQCKERFWFVHSLILHLGVHKANEPHVCLDCGRRFVRKNSLTLHRKSKHNQKVVG